MVSVTDLDGWSLLIICLLPCLSPALKWGSNTESHIQSPNSSLAASQSRGFLGPLRKQSSYGLYICGLYICGAAFPAGLPQAPPCQGDGCPLLWQLSKQPRLLDLDGLCLRDPDSVCGFPCR